MGMPLCAAEARNCALSCGADRQTNLEKAAQAEGSVVWYTSIALGESSRYVELFEKRYPLSKSAWCAPTPPGWRSDTAPNTQAGTFLADVLDTGDTTIEFFRRRGCSSRIIPRWQRNSTGDLFNSKFLGREPGDHDCAWLQYASC